jgi:hypothetical protein
MDDERADRHDEDHETDADTVPAAPGKSDTPLGDTDQHSDAAA